MATVTIPQWTRGERLIKSRKDAHISPPAMALRLGVSVKTIYNYEKNRPIKKSTLIAWAQATGVNLHWLRFGEDEDPNRCLISGECGCACTRYGMGRTALDRVA